MVIGGSIIGKVARMVSHFREHGLTLSDYLRAAVRQPQLFYQLPSTIQRNIEQVVTHFRRNPCSCPQPHPLERGRLVVTSLVTRQRRGLLPRLLASVLAHGCFIRE
jgi:hypothetical protein